MHYLLQAEVGNTEFKMILLVMRVKIIYFLFFTITVISWSLCV